MVLLDAPPVPAPPVEPARGRVVRSPCGTFSTVVFPNGTEVPLHGGVGIFSGMYPPNYLDDLRSSDQ